MTGIASILAPSSVDQHTGGLSGGAIGGLIGGILGIILLFSVGALFYLLAHRSRSNIGLANQSPRRHEKPDEAAVIPAENMSAENFQTNNTVDSNFGGRLQYPNDDVVEGGRLGSSV